ncbi:hypothetical protein Pelo_7510 [Pelomyxa schiedti]|nr:hypothetical protein Pelo_7510 [Pelomyxa schiedti]
MARTRKAIIVMLCGYEVLVHGLPLGLSIIAVVLAKVTCGSNLRLYLLMEAVTSFIAYMLATVQYLYFLRKYPVKEGFENMNQSIPKTLESVVSLFHCVLSVYGFRQLRSSATASCGYPPIVHHLAACCLALCPVRLAIACCLYPLFLIGIVGALPGAAAPAPPSSTYPTASASASASASATTTTASGAGASDSAQRGTHKKNVRKRNGTS